MKPFLLLATRAEDLAADDEYAAFLRFGGLDERDLERRRIERDPLGDLDLDRYSGVILGGSPYTITDPEDEKSAAQVRVEAELIELMDEIIDRDFPLLGACYGIAIVGRHEGAVIDRTFSEPVGAATLRLTEAGRADPLFSVLPDVFEAFLGHKEAITKLPDDAVHLASSEACPVQAFRVRTNIYATQFHPGARHTRHPDQDRHLQGLRVLRPHRGAGAEGRRRSERRRPPAGAGAPFRRAVRSLRGFLRPGPIAWTDERSSVVLAGQLAGGLTNR